MSVGGFSLETLRAALADNERYTNPWPDFCPEPEVVLALVEAVEAALVVYREWHGGEPRYPEEDALETALAKFDFGGSS